MTVPRIRDQKHLSKNSYWIQLSSFMSHQNDVFAAAFSSAANASPIPNQKAHETRIPQTIVLSHQQNPTVNWTRLLHNLMTRSKRKSTIIWSKHQDKNRNYRFKETDHVKRSNLIASDSSNDHFAFLQISKCNGLCRVKALMVLEI